MGGGGGGGCTRRERRMVGTRFQVHDELCGWDGEGGGEVGKGAGFFSTRPDQIKIESWR